MGFYHPATLITDALRHGVEVRPVDVMRSTWRCDLEGKNVIRLGLKYVAGLHEEVGRRLESQRAARPFSSLADLQTRVMPNPSEMATLAEIGALGAIGGTGTGTGTRRQALWQVQALERSGALFGRVSPSDQSPLAEMTPAEETGADFRGTGVSTGPHPLAALRAELTQAGVVSAAQLTTIPDGRRARVGGIVIVRQRPGTAKGFVFLTLEDETGFANAIITPARFAAHQTLLVTNHALIVEGVVQNQQGVVSIKADRFSILRGRPAEVDISHDFH
jgi:error-prone DNA polymerase